MKALIGFWRTDPGDKKALRDYGEVTMEFFPDGTLKYTVQHGEGQQIMFLTYAIEGGFLITDQPSHPRLEKTKFTVTNTGELVLDDGQHVSRYVKVRES